MTREEFGINLFNAIKAISGTAAIDAQRAQAIHRDDKTKTEDLLQRRQVNQSELARLLPLLTDDEMAQILARYPWVAKC